MRILVLSARLPYPHNSGAKIRAFELMKVLASRHQVTLLSFFGNRKEERNFKIFEEIGVKLLPIHRKKIDASVGLSEVIFGFFSGLPFTVTKYRDNRMSSALKKLLPEHDVIHCEHAHMAQYLMNVYGKIKVLDAHNVEAQIAKRLAPIETNPFKRVLLAWNAKAMYQYERKVCPMFDLVLAVSNQDRESISQQYQSRNTRLLENGVDLNFFKKAPAEIAQQLKLVFVGLMGWMPNSDGVKYFVSEILPMIKRKFPEIKLDLVGKDPPEEIVRLSEIPGVRVTGTVDDVRPYVWDSQVFIVPLRFGGGTRLKILEAFAMHRPVVSTSLGCEGIACRHEKELLIADTSSEFADAVIRLLEDSSLCAELTANAERLVEKTYGWQHLGEKLLHYYDEL